MKSLPNTGITVWIAALIVSLLAIPSVGSPKEQSPFNEALLPAAKSGSAEQVKKCLDAGEDPDAIWPSTRTIHLLAAIGIPIGLAAAGIGFWLGAQRMIELLS